MEHPRFHRILRIAANERFAEPDYAKQREAIVAWVRETKMRVFLVLERTDEVPRLRPLLFDPLPADVKPHVVLTFEMHSPIMAIADGTPAILRQPNDASKGQMWCDVGLDSDGE